MKNLKNYLVKALIVVIAITAVGAYSACKKGTDDPVISLKSRKDRFTNSWTLTKYEKDGVNQDISGSTYTYNVLNSGSLTETIEGSVFGFPTRSTREGTWEFVNDEEDVKITFSNEVVTYNVQRLASTELWLKRFSGGNTHVYYFEGQ